ncbi:hypothetical protein CDD81_7473 [Ophiocordyceps australis]|uniref:Uncharacterized protein n=1 Tax=Ophiocordyceps australis TaxID=1399860 RepID=A0A2C5XLH3_9HYPO|nr:hypothetical protein CDD81_7473 [Ophiocordyceps australis]
MSKRWYFETTTTGRQHVSVKRSRSHHHHHHHRHRHELDSYLVGREEWKRFIERERLLEGRNKTLAADVDALTLALAAAQTEATHLRRHVIPQLQDTTTALRDNNERLRRSLESKSNTWPMPSRQEDELRREVERLQRQNKELQDATPDPDKDSINLDEEREDLRRGIAELRGENASLKSRLMALSRQAGDSCGRRLTNMLGDMEYWKEQCKYWKAKFENEALRYQDTKGMLEIRTDKMKAYEELLKGRKLI